MNLDTITAAVQTVEKGLSSSRSDLLAIEEPLQLCLNSFPLSITMRTPGSDLDLATGFLLHRGDYQRRWPDSVDACRIGRRCF